MKLLCYVFFAVVVIVAATVFTLFHIVFFIFIHLFHLFVFIQQNDLIEIFLFSFVVVVFSPFTILVFSFGFCLTSTNAWNCAAFHMKLEIHLYLIVCLNEMIVGVILFFIRCLFYSYFSSSSAVAAAAFYIIYRNVNFF